MSEDRRHPRLQHSGVIFISWQTIQGDRNHALGRCLDVSEHGVGLALYKRIPVGSFVKVQADSLNLDCSAIVRHAARSAGRYVLGLELGKPVDQDVLAALSQAESAAVAAAPVPVHAMLSRRDTSAIDRRSFRVGASSAGWYAN